MPRIRLLLINSAPHSLVACSTSPTDLQHTYQSFFAERRDKELGSTPEYWTSRRSHLSLRPSSYAMGASPFILFIAVGLRARQRSAEQPLGNANTALMRLSLRM
ncbi:hypothetical protein B0H19DRAFT_1200302, partial [Mycena capillaripes]